jgi:hypothetical protein
MAYARRMRDASMMTMTLHARAKLSYDSENDADDE